MIWEWTEVVPCPFLLNPEAKIVDLPIPRSAIHLEPSLLSGEDGRDQNINNTIKSQNSIAFSCHGWHTSRASPATPDFSRFVILNSSNFWFWDTEGNLSSRIRARKVVVGLLPLTHHFEQGVFLAIDSLISD